jgi:NhaP-type Na+/H+ or K+/H+ antiporter
MLPGTALLAALVAALLVVLLVVLVARLLAALPFSAIACHWRHDAQPHPRPPEPQR